MSATLDSTWTNYFYVSTFAQGPGGGEGLLDPGEGGPGGGDEGDPREGGPGDPVSLGPSVGAEM